MYINTNKDKMIEAAYSLSLKYGFDNVSIKQIQEEANVSAGALYYYFKDKNDLLACMIDRFVNDLIGKYKESVRNYEGTFAEKLKFSLYHHAGQEYKNEDYDITLLDGDKIDPSEYDLFLLGVYHQHPEIRPLFHEVNKEMLKFYEEFVEEFKEKKEIRSDIDTKDAALFIFTVFAGFIKSLLGFPDISFEEFSDINVKMICNTVGYQEL